MYAEIGAAVAVQIVTAAVGLGTGRVWLLVAGAALLIAVAGAELSRFARHNGVRLGGFASRVVLGTGTGASLAYAVPLAVAIWAGYGVRWWLVAVAAVVGGIAYPVCGWRWMRAYRERPEQLGPATRPGGWSASPSPRRPAWWRCSPTVDGRAGRPPRCPRA